MSIKGKLLSAVLFGAAAGAILGVLFAPDKGNSTRKQISKKAQGLIDRFSKKMKKRKSTFADFKKKAMTTEDAG